MKCIKCGAERQKYQLDEGGCRTAETLPQCRDAISAQLASMTKRAEEAEVWGQDTVCRLTNEKEAAEAKLASMTKRAEEAERALQENRETWIAQVSQPHINEALTRCAACGEEATSFVGTELKFSRDALKAKLATAEKGLTNMATKLDRCTDECSAAKDVRFMIIDTLYTLGIDPSKEQKK